MANDANRPQNISQLDLGTVLRDSHDFDGRALRVRDTVSTVEDYFTHYRAIYNGSNRPTQTTYYLGTQPHKVQVATASDIAGSLNNTYFFIHDSRTDQTYHVWYNVSGGGIDPAPANSLPIEIPIDTGDDAIFVAQATAIVINNTYPRIFDARRISGVVVKITNKRFGEAPDALDATTGFLISNEDGTEEIVDVINISYSGDDPIYEGEVLKGYTYNIFTGKFELNQPTNLSAEIDVEHPNICQIINKTIVTKNVEVSQLLPDATQRYKIRVRDDKAQLKLAFGVGETSTDYLTIDRGFIWDSHEMDLPNSSTIYLKSTQNNIVVEIKAWRRI